MRWECSTSNWAGGFVVGRSYWQKGGKDHGKHWANIDFRGDSLLPLDPVFVGTTRSKLAQFFTPACKDGQPNKEESLSKCGEAASEGGVEISLLNRWRCSNETHRGVTGSDPDPMASPRRLGGADGAYK